jgi:hypothetical protein
LKQANTNAESAATAVSGADPLDGLLDLGIGDLLKARNALPVEEAGAAIDEVSFLLVFFIHWR